MRKILKFVKHNLLGFVFGIILGGIGITTAASLLSSSIEYDKSKSEKYVATATNVEQALNELYENDCKNRRYYRDSKKYGYYNCEDKINWLLNDLKETYKEEYINEGITIGEDNGRNLEKMEIAQKLFVKGMSEAEVVEIVGISIKKSKKLKKVKV